MYAHSQLPGSRYEVAIDHKKLAQYLNTSYDSWAYKHIFRMVLRFLGKYYEHQRPDRNHYITINWDNIAPGTYLPTYLQYLML